MQYKAVNRSSQYLVHFNKNHDPKNGRFTTGYSESTPSLSPREIAQENGRMFKAMKKGAKLRDFKGNRAIRSLAKDIRLQKAAAQYKEKYDTYKRTGQTKGLNSASEEYTIAKYNVLSRYVGPLNSNNPKTYFKKDLSSFTGDRRDSIFVDSYMNRVSSLIDHELEMDEVTKYGL